MHFNNKRLYKDLNSYRMKSSLSWRQLGAKAHVAPCTFTRMGQSKQLGSVNTFKLVKFLGVSHTRYIVVD